MPWPEAVKRTALLRTCQLKVRPAARVAVRQLHWIHSYLIGVVIPSGLELRIELPQNPYVVPAK